MSLQMHELIQSMAREIVREKFDMPGNRSRLWISSEFDSLSESKVTEEVEVLVVMLKNGQKISVDGKAFTRMKNLRILKICFPVVEGLSQPFEVNFSGSLDFLSNELRLFYWHGCPFKYLPSDFYPQNIVSIDLSYSQIKHIWKTPKCFRRLKVMKLRYCCNLTTTPDFSEITNLEELSLEGCVNLVSVHPSIGMLKRLVVLNLRDCKRLLNFPSRVEMDALQDLNLSGCLNVNQLPESFWSRWWILIPRFIWNQQYPQKSVSLAGLHMLTSLTFSFCNLEQVPESIGGLSFLQELDLEGNNFTSLPGSLTQLSQLGLLKIDGCKKLEVLPKLPPSVWNINAFDCTSLREVSGPSKDPFTCRYKFFSNCPNLFKNVSMDSQGSISKTRCLDSSITSQGFNHQLSAFVGLFGFQTNMFKFFLQDTGYYFLDIAYHGNSIPECFTNRSTENHVKVELPSDWCFDEFRGYGICVVLNKKKHCQFPGFSLKNFDGNSIVQSESDDFFPRVFKEFLKKEVTEIHESYMILLNYTNDTKEWKEAKNFVTFCFKENNEDVEVKEFGARLICDGDLRQDGTNFMFQELSQHGGAMSLHGPIGYSGWSW